MLVWEGGVGCVGGPANGDFFGVNLIRNYSNKLLYRFFLYCTRASPGFTGSGPHPGVSRALPHNPFRTATKEDFVFSVVEYIEHINYIHMNSLPIVHTAFGGIFSY